MTTPSPDERDAILRAFHKAQFRRDMDAFYKVAAPDFLWRVPIGPLPPSGREIRNRAELAAFLAERASLYEDMRVDDVVYSHAPDATFLSFHLTARKRATGEAVDVLGLESYLFRDALVIRKDSYWKRIAVE